MSLKQEVTLCGIRSCFPLPATVGFDRSFSVLDQLDGVEDFDLSAVEDPADR